MRTISVVMAVLLLLPVQTFAAGKIDLSKGCTLTVSYRNGDTPLTGAGFSIYYAAEVDENGELTPTKTFSQFNVKIKGRNDSAWNALAVTLEGYVLRDKITPFDSGKTDSKGLLTFPTAGKTLKPGLYLVLGSRHEQKGIIYDAQPFMVMVPLQDKETNDWNYNVTVSPKHESSLPEKGTVTRKVLKVWQDGGNKADRPDEITVELLQDGDVYDTVTLSADNRWRYTWEDLDAGHRWTMVEDAEDGYTVEVVRKGITFVITNSSTVDVPDNSTPKDSTPHGNSTPGEPLPHSSITTPGPDLVDVPDNQTPLINPPSSKVPLSAGPKLPQTGQLWWPVPILVCAGIFCIAVGLIRRREIFNEEQKR